MSIDPGLAEHLDRSALAFCRKFGHPLPELVERPADRPTGDCAPAPSVVVPPVVKSARPEPVRQLALAFAD
jgi:hypothetical protein